METMSAYKALQLHMKGKLAADDVLKATGFDRLSEVAYEYNCQCEDLEMAAHHWTAEEIEQEELEQLAWSIYQPLLAEEPDYLSTLVRQLKEKKRQNFLKFAAVFAESRRRSRGENVISLRPRSTRDPNPVS